MSDDPSDDGARQDKPGRGGCLWLLGMLLAAWAFAWGVGAGVSAIDAWRTPAAYDPLVPFRSGFIDLSAQTLNRQSATLWTRLVVGGMFWMVGGAMLLLVVGGIARAVSAAFSGRVVIVGVVVIALGAFVYTPAAAILLPLYPVVVDAERRVLELRERRFFGPFSAWGSTIERTVPFSAVRRLGHRVDDENFRGGGYTRAEVLAYVDAEPGPEWILLGAAEVESGELDLASWFRSRASIDQEAFDLGLRAAEALTGIIGVEAPPFSRRKNKEEFR